MPIAVAGDLIDFYIFLSPPVGGLDLVTNRKGAI